MKLPIYSKCKIWYVGAFRFPDKDAAAARVLGIGRALRSAGYEVVFAGGEATGLPGEERQAGGWEHDGFEYHPMGELDRTGGAGVRRLFRYLGTGRCTADWVTKRLERGERPAAVILYNGLAGYHTRLAPACRRHGIPLLVDLTEWYSPSQCVGGRWGLHRWDVEWTNRVLIPRCQGVLAISTYLEDYYRGRGCKVLRVPPLVDLEAGKWRVPPKPVRGEFIELVYAGTPGRKDALGEITRALVSEPGFGGAVRLRVIGIGDEAWAAYLQREGIDPVQAARRVTLIGRVPQAEVPLHLAAGDYGVLLRPNARYSRAGFPTKIVECLAAGTGVVANPVGDLGRYVREGREGWLVPDSSSAALIETLKRALLAGPEAAREIGRAARRLAIEKFDYRNHVEGLGRFMAEAG
jgi:glycosyltransferase involved in cell wall biosynthesis